MIFAALLFGASAYGHGYMNVPMSRTGLNAKVSWEHDSTSLHLMLTEHHRLAPTHARNAPFLNQLTRSQILTKLKWDDRAHVVTTLA